MMRKLYSLRISFLLIGFIVVCACSAGAPISQERERIMSADTGCDFESIPEHAAMKDPCSPEIEESDFEWRGIKINMPDKVSITGGEYGVLSGYEMRVPVFILLQVTLDRIAKYEFEREGINLIFVDQKTGKSFTDNLLESNPSLPMEKPEFSQEEMKSRVSRYYYNINALEFLELPSGETTYDVYASFEEFKSNVMTVTLK